MGKSKIEIDAIKKGQIVSDENAKKTLNVKEQVSAMKQYQLDIERRDKEHVRDEERKASNRRKGMFKEKDGRLVSHWDHAKSKFDDFRKPSSQNSYIEWQTTMMEIFEAAYSMSIAMYYNETIPTLAGDLYDNTVKFAWQKTVGNTVVGKVLEGTLYSVKETPRMLGRHALNGIGKLWGKEGPMPERIDYDVSIAEDGTVSTKVLMDGQEVAPEVTMLFDTGLIAWLELKHNCTFDPATQKITDATGQLVTAQKIAELNTDDDNSLNHFFTSREDLDLHSSISMSPR